MAAHELRAQGHHVTVFEANDWIGGRARTVRRNGFMFDTGAVGLLGSYDLTKTVAESVGMGDQVLTIKPIGSVPRDGRLRQLDMGHPLRSFLKTDLLSFRSKLKLWKVAADARKLSSAMDYEQVASLVEHDTESVRDYSLRELNEELYQYLTGTLVRGAWLAPPEGASVAQFFWTAKHFTPHMYSLVGGMDSLPTRLLEGSEVRLNTAVANVERSDAGVVVTYGGDMGEQTDVFDGCVIAAPPRNALELYPQLQGPQRRFFESAEYSQSVNVHLGLSRATAHPEMYVMVPERECADVTTIFLDHHKAPDRAPAGKGIISVFMRAGWCADNWETPDDRVISQVVEHLRPWFGDLEPLLEDVLVQRWENCALMVKPGAFRLMAEADRAVDPNDPVQFAGDYAPFSSVNTSILSGRKAASRLNGSLSGRLGAHAAVAL
ncbi:hypothetical protein DSM112329_04231 [Paraconexibacter sp. AEG42_29]|uniref:Amine oxidase domain-containing protein n=2 Tax=Paraconexibacter sp. AEG42_29 TaxID=2997339 RepID=A0AAU7B0D2_9ACTN